MINFLAKIVNSSVKRDYLRCLNGNIPEVILGGIKTDTLYNSYVENKDPSYFFAFI